MEKQKPGQKNPEQQKPEQQKKPPVGKRPGQPSVIKKGAIYFSKAFPAKVEEIIGRTGSRGEAIQVRCKILEGRDANKSIRRNVKGPIQIGDMLMLRETEIEAKQLSKAGRGSV